MSQSAKEAVQYLKDMEREAFEHVDVAECTEKYPHRAPSGEMSGRILYYRSILDSAGYLVEWDCERGGYSIRRKAEPADSQNGSSATVRSKKDTLQTDDLAVPE